MNLEGEVRRRILFATQVGDEQQKQLYEELLADITAKRSSGLRDVEEGVPLHPVTQITRKWQTTIPSKIHHALGLNRDAKVAWILEGDHARLHFIKNPPDK